MKKFKIHYEEHIHKEDGTYDKKLSDKERIVSENYMYKCRPWWKDQNKIEEYSINQIKKHLREGYFHNVFMGSRQTYANYLLSDGETIDRKYHFEKIIKVEYYE